MNRQRLEAAVAARLARRAQRSSVKPVAPPMPPALCVAPGCGLGAEPGGELCSFHELQPDADDIGLAYHRGEFFEKDGGVGGQIHQAGWGAKGEQPDPNWRAPDVTQDDEAGRRSTKPKPRAVVAPAGATTCTGPGGRGCPCAFHVHRRTYVREWSRRRRAAKLGEQVRHAETCPRRQGSGVCGGRIRVDVGPLGESILVCEACERRKQGICRDCNAPVYGLRLRATRCALHAEEARLRSVAASGKRHAEEYLENQRRRYWENQDKRARDNEYKRLWRKANPEKVRAQKQRYIERHAGESSSAYERYHARYRQTHRLHYRDLQNTKNAIAREVRPVPLCKDCGKKTGWTPVTADKPGKPWTTCMKCAWPHQRRARRRVRRAAAKRIAADPRFGLPPKPVRIRRPAAPAVRGPGYERLCITPGCDIVVTHRKKKCTKCQQRDAELARRQLEAHRGRGRRTDRERVA